MSGETAEWVWRQRAAELEAERDAALRERDSLEHQRDVLIVYCDEEVERLIQVEARSVTRVWGKVRELEAERDAALAERNLAREWVSRIWATTEQEMWDARNGPDSWALELKREYATQRDAALAWADIAVHKIQKWGQGMIDADWNEALDLIAARASLGSPDERKT